MAKSSLIGRVAVDFVATTGKMLAPIKQAQAGIASFAKTATLMKVTLAALPFAAVARGVARATNRLGDLSDESKRLGIPADELSNLQSIAAQAGVDVGSLGKSLQYMMKKGFSVSDIGKIADEIDSITDPVKKMQTVLKYFGRGGSGMINMFEGGSKALNRLREENKALGIEVTQQQADMVERMGDKWGRLKDIWTGIWNRIAIEFAPLLEVMAMKVLDVFVKIGPAISAAMRGMGDVIVDSIAAVMDAIQGLSETMETLWVFATTLKFPDFSKRGFKSDALRKRIAGIRSEPGAKFGMGSSLAMAGAGGNDMSMAALIKGSQAAFQAIAAGYKKKIEEEQLAELKKHTKLLGDIKVADPLEGADLE